MQCKAYCIAGKPSVDCRLLSRSSFCTNSWPQYLGGKKLSHIITSSAIDAMEFEQSLSLVIGLPLTHKKPLELDQDRDIHAVTCLLVSSYN